MSTGPQTGERAPNAECTYLSGLVASLVVARGVAPGGSVAYAVRTERGWVVEAGASGIRSPSRPDPVGTETVYDLASVTKPVIATVVARLVRHGRFRWDTPLQELLEEARGTPTGAATLELLLSHRAGLEAHLELFAPLRDRARVESSQMLQTTVHARRTDCTGAPPPEGFAPLYSDLGYLLLGVAIERAEATVLDEIVAREVGDPLGLELTSARLFRLRSRERFESVAPTETVSFRGGEVVGMVHDENAFALAGDNIAGHAGLFGTATAVVKFGAAVLDALAGRTERWLSARDVEPLVRVRPGASLRAGFDGKSETGSSAGECFGPESFGHLGFTGTSVWCDPRAGIAVAALTNRVCPSRENLAIREVRPALHGALHRRAAGRLGGGS